jgi:hypothetical protein
VNAQQTLHSKHCTAHTQLTQYCLLKAIYYGIHVYVSAYYCAGVWNLVDGDKMAALVAQFLQEELTLAGLNHRLSFAVVQTAYANGAATAFMKQRNIRVSCSSTLSVTLLWLLLLA